jgi:peptide methionine sulfoxide reductase msrA/msrB
VKNLSEEASMRRTLVLVAVLAVGLFVTTACGEQEMSMAKEEHRQANSADSGSYRELTPAEERVIVQKGTEMPFTGEYYDHFEPGTYHCRRCDAPLYSSTDKFNTSCGWPSFDDEIPGAVRRERDADGMRTEILCANCGAHLGHVFEGERLTDKNVRHCVNSISLVFKPDSESAAVDESAPGTAKAYFAGGCFWGVEHLFEQKEGVVAATSGYMGGSTEDPSYREVCSGRTGHFEAVEVEYDPETVTYEELAKYFFEIHDPTQSDGQGPDRGSQYLSAVFYGTDDEKATAERLIGILRQKGYDVATMVLPNSAFWPAEDYHQDYYERKGSEPYCHGYTRRF